MHSIKQVQVGMKCLFGLIVVTTQGCSNSGDKTSSQPAAPTSPASIVKAVLPPPTTEQPKKPTTDAFGVPFTFHPKYILKEDDNINFGSKSTRRKVRIVVPAGLSDAEVENNMRLAAKKAYSSDNNPHAIMVFAYKPGTDIHNQYTAGRLFWAPGGDWERADEDVPIEAHEGIADIYENYRPKPKEKPTAGESEFNAMVADADAEQQARIRKTDKRLSESKRRRIYYVFQKGLFNAEDTVPNIGNALDNAMKQNDVSIRAKYHISDDELDSIRVEGDRYGWPQPQP